MNDQPIIVDAVGRPPVKRRLFKRATSEERDPTYVPIEFLSVRVNDSQVVSSTVRRPSRIWTKEQVDTLTEGVER